MSEAKIVYASSVMREQDFADLFRDAANIPGQQAQKFNRLMIKGIEKNGYNVLTLSAPPITKHNTSACWVSLKKVKDGKITYKYLPVFNVVGVRNILTMVSSFFGTFFALIGRRGAVVCDVLNVSVALGAVIAGRVLGKPCIGIVTDVPELMVTGHSEKQVKYCHKIIGDCTHYVFLTEAMNERLNPKAKPYTIVEGICNEELEYSKTSDSSEKICLYAGLLDAEYGVKTMVEAFIKANVNDSKLYICGKGPYTEELKEIARNNPSIEYKGVLFNNDVVEMEKQATLLINPRPSKGEFTKFSFPSKIMEYMTSGTAVLATKLPGIPDEYYDYIYSFSGETVDQMTQSIKDVLSLEKCELDEKGKTAYDYVTLNKSAKAQAKKVLDFVKTSFNI